LIRVLRFSSGVARVILVRRRRTPPENKEIAMTTTTDSLAAADRFADDLVARQLTDEQALDECRLGGITLPEGEHWQYYLDAARTRRDEQARNAMRHVYGRGTY
jgi:hypothetical protein